MSRTSPFPTRPGRSLPQSGNGSQPPATRPLQIGRPTTPSNSAVSPAAQIQGGPSRPQRSELRSRQVSEYSNSEMSSYRDSFSTNRSDASQPYTLRNGTSNSPITPTSRRRVNVSPVNTETSPTMVTVLSAFQSAGARQRSMTNGSEDMEYSRNRQREAEAESARQQRIREKVPGRRMNGKARAGDIDGMCNESLFVINLNARVVLIGFAFSSHSRSNKRRVGVCNRPRCKFVNQEKPLKLIFYVEYSSIMWTWHFNF